MNHASLDTVLKIFQARGVLDLDMAVGLKKTTVGYCSNYPKWYQPKSEVGFHLHGHFTGAPASVRSESHCGCDPGAQ